MTKIKINKDVVPQKLIFASRDNPYNCLCILTIDSILDGGTPIDPETGEDLEFLGIAADETPEGDYSAVNCVIEGLMPPQED